MHKFLASLQAAFFAADRDRSGTIDAMEIHNALAAAGFQVHHHRRFPARLLVDSYPDPSSLAIWFRQVSLPVVQTFMMIHNKTGYGVNFHQFLLICATIGTPH
jgi:hypothetical protein